MTQLMTIWSVTVSLLAFVLIIRTMYHFRMSILRFIKVHHIIGIEKNANIFYCPGDIIEKENK